MASKIEQTEANLRVAEERLEETRITAPFDGTVLKLLKREGEARTWTSRTWINEKRMSWLRECVESFSSARSVTESGYVRHLVETLLTLTMHGECIIVGRGANVVAPPETTLRIRLTAPLHDRIATVQKRRNLSVEAARQWVETTDRACADDFVKDHFHKEGDAADLHDLVLNTSR